MIEYKNLYDKDAKKEIIKDLRENKCLIDFTKSDGTKRQMISTLKIDFLPKEILKENYKSEPMEELVEKDFLTVYDIEKKNWRRFKYESINSIKIILESK